MPTEVWTARISCNDKDVFNITRKSGNKVFAPSWDILGPMVQIKKAGRGATDEEWKAYAASYLKEMARSYRVERAAWEALLARKRVVLTCYCTDPNHCHRRILARILASLGADDHGEL